MSKTTWAGYSWLEGQTVVGVQDGAVAVFRRPDNSTGTTTTVQAGVVELTVAANTLEIGLAFAHSIEPWPPAVPSGQDGGPSRSMRPYHLTLQVHDTDKVRVIRGGKAYVLNVVEPVPAASGERGDAITGEARTALRGWERNRHEPLYRIEDDRPAPLTVLSADLELAYHD